METVGKSLKPEIPPRPKAQAANPWRPVGKGSCPHGSRAIVYIYIYIYVLVYIYIYMYMYIYICIVTHTEQYANIYRFVDSSMNRCIPVLICYSFVTRIQAWARSVWGSVARLGVLSSQKVPTC